jgi:hypothetical protein
MKKVVLTFGALAMAVSVFAQGTVNFNNQPGTIINTNASASGGTIGPANGALGGPFYYGLFIAPVGQTIGGTNADLFSGPWTFTGSYATNTATGGRLSGGSTLGVPVSGWAGGTSMDYVVAGWSASIGHDWAQVAPIVQTGVFPGFYGHSVIGEGISGGGPLGQPVLALFGASAPAIPGFQILSSVPEPTTFALAGLGAAAMLIFRRRK